VNDSFHVGEPAPPSRAVTVSPTAIAVTALVVALIAVAVAFLLLVNEGGEEASQAQSSAVSAADIASDRSAQSSVRNAVAAAKTAWTDASTYAGVTPEALAAIEPSLTFTSGASTADTVVSVAFADQEAGIAALSTTGTCFWWHEAAGEQYYGSGTPCTGQAAFAAADPSW
jgi:hypothetical protein